MIRHIFFLALLTGSVHAQQAKPAGFRVEGHIRGIAEKSRVSLTDANKPTDTLARGIVNGGVFVLAGHVNEPNLFVLNFLDAQKKTTLFIGNENVSMTGDIDNLASVQVKGSPSEADFQAFERTFNPYFAQLNQLSQQANMPQVMTQLLIIKIG